MRLRLRERLRDCGVASPVAYSCLVEPDVARLARLGFSDARRAHGLLGGLPEVNDDPQCLGVIGGVADPDQAVLLLGRFAECLSTDERAQFFSEMSRDPDLRRRLLSVLGMSAALGEHLVRHPLDWRMLRSSVPTPRPGADEHRSNFLAAVGADPTATSPIAAGHGNDELGALRVVYRQQLLRLAAADLDNDLGLEEVTELLTEYADAVLETCLAIARSEVAEHADCRLSVISMGKCGARELNYISDVDVIFVAEAADGVAEDRALRVATKLASALMRAANQHTAEGTIWEVDPNLRPEGRAGALVRTLKSHKGYYERWAHTWEFQALLKARAAAGDAELGADYVRTMSQFVWSAADRDNFVEDVQGMRRRVERHVSGPKADRELKLGEGGLRDVEFSVQLLQLVHGRSDVMLRSSNTLEALEALANWGYVGRKDAADLSAAYRFLRTMEHRLQLHRLKRTHVVPESPGDLRRLGRSMGYLQQPADELEKQWRVHGRQVRQLHEKLFYRPLLQAVAKLDAGEARLSTDAARTRLRALGFRDPDGALNHMQALTNGVSRRAAIQRTLLPVMLDWFSDSPDADAALLGFRRVSDALGSSPWYLRTLRDQVATAQRLAKVLGTSRYASDLLLRAPEGVKILANPEELKPRTRDSLTSEALSIAARNDDPDSAAQALRAMRRRELFRLAVTEISRPTTVDEIGTGLSDVAAAAIAGALQSAVRTVSVQRAHKARTRFAVIGMGRFGGAELGFASDADVVFVHDPLPGADQNEAQKDAVAIANELRRILTLPSPDPPLEIDADLRPEGKSGPLARSLKAYQAYYSRWASAWEAQALIRADFVAGDSLLGAEFLASVDSIRYPSGGVAEDALREMRRLKARMEAERLPRGADPKLHTKLGRGGLSDVEWAVQLLQMQHGNQHPELRTPHTITAIESLRGLELLTAEDADRLAEAWGLATRMRNAVLLASGKPSDMVPADLHDLVAIGAVLSLPEEIGPMGVQEEYLRVTRRARKVAERIFFGEPVQSVYLGG